MNTTDISADELIDFALRRSDELEQEAHVLSQTQPYDWIAFRARAQQRASAYRQFVRIAEEIKKQM